MPVTYLHIELHELTNLSTDASDCLSVPSDHAIIEYPADDLEDKGFRLLERVSHSPHFGIFYWHAVYIYLGRVIP